eukprot:TRINITY_DN6726_c0_g1_i1.p1 TRINITY_DN6726_c0_g1~~TRINITY_DN6726_c0_g1_i1.p1  ORF type:complete len:204 (-),score=35.78 TRINITY_DN6726_c0_g1_i1:185-796(-)
MNQVNSTIFIVLLSYIAQTASAGVSLCRLRNCTIVEDVYEIKVVQSRKLNMLGDGGGIQPVWPPCTWGPITLPSNNFVCNIDPCQCPVILCAFETLEEAKNPVCCFGKSYANCCLAACSGDKVIPQLCTAGLCDNKKNTRGLLASEDKLSDCYKYGACCDEYVMKEGESICDVANTHNKSCDDLKAFNDVHDLLPGDIIQICA